MAPTFPEPFFYLRPDETPILKIRPEGGYAVAAFLAMLVPLLVLAGAGIAFGTASGQTWLVVTSAVALAVLLLVAGLVAWRRWATTEYVITDARIYARVGRLRTRVHFTTHDRVTDVNYHRGILDRLFGLSHVTFTTAGGDVHIRGVADALAIKETAEDARDALVEELIGDREISRAATPSATHRAAAGSEPWQAGDEGPAGARPASDAAPQGAGPVAPAPPLPKWDGPRPEYVKHSDTVVWYGKPKLVAALDQVGIGLLVFVFVAGPAAGPFAPLVALLAAAVLVFPVLQLRFTEYVVTDQRVYVKTGVLGTTVKQLTYEKITDITYQRKVLGRVLGYGAITVNTAGSNEAPAAMNGLDDPLGVKERIERARAHALGEVRA